MAENNPDSTVNERINNLVNVFSNGNKSAFATTVGISNQSLGEIVGKRQSAPSFAALQKIVVAFPQVRLPWLILGQGQMLEKETVAPSRESTSKNKGVLPELTVEVTVLHRALLEIMCSPRSRMYIPPWGPTTIYNVADKTSRACTRRRLSDRLGISEREAERLVRSGEIQSKKISDDEGYRVSEQWVLDYMAGTSQESPSFETVQTA